MAYVRLAEGKSMCHHNWEPEHPQEKTQDFEQVNQLNFELNTKHMFKIHIHQGQKKDSNQWTYDLFPVMFHLFISFHPRSWWRKWRCLLHNFRRWRGCEGWPGEGWRHMMAIQWNDPWIIMQIASNETWKQRLIKLIIKTTLSNLSFRLYVPGSRCDGIGLSFCKRWVSRE